MFEGCVLGVDPGMAAVGLAAVGTGEGKPRVLWASTFRTPAGLPEAERLRQVHRAVRDALAEHDAAAVAVERVMWGKNVGSAMSVSRATGVVLLAAADAGIPVFEYAPLEVKMAATGVGNAGKDLVRRALKKTHGLANLPSDPDAVDAVAVAFCHLQQSGLRAAVRKAAAR